MSVVLGLQSTWGAAPATQFLPYAHARPSIGSGGFFSHERGQKIAHFKTRLLLSFSFAAAAYLLALKYSEWPRPRLDAWGVVASGGHSKPKFQAQAHKHILVPHILFLPPRCGGNSIVLLPLPCSYGGARKKEEYWEEHREAEELKSSSYLPFLRVFCITFTKFVGYFFFQKQMNCNSSRSNPSCLRPLQSL